MSSGCEQFVSRRIHSILSVSLTLLEAFILSMSTIPELNHEEWKSNYQYREKC
jgi:hypothetical protein